jgi:hypothetical protein
MVSMFRRPGRLGGARGRSLGLLILVGAVAVPARAATPAEGSACREGSTRLCLLGRYEVESTWRDGEGRDRAALALPLASSGTGAFSLFGSEDADLLVRMTAERQGSRPSIEAGAAAGVGYELRVRDTVSGAEWIHAQPRSGGDRLAAGFLEGGAGQRFGPDLAKSSDRCVASATELCFLGGRFRVTASFRHEGVGDMAWGRSASDETGLFSASADGDAQVAVRVVDGRAVNGSIWLLYTALSSAEVEIELTDLATGASRRFVKAAGGPASEAVVDALSASATGVKVTLDTPRAVKGTIPVTGGTLQAVSANGTKLTLTIPPNALLSPQEITFTPIKGVGGLPFQGGLAGGAEIGPAGLRLARTATLRIAPPQPVPLAQETTFGYRGRGGEFFLFPAALAGRPVVLRVIHAGGYGLALGTAAEQARQLGRLPPRAEDQFDQKRWNVHAQRRRAPKGMAERSIHGFTAAAAPPAGDLATLYRQVYDNQLRKLLPQIGGSCAGRKKWGPLGENFVANGMVDGVASSLPLEVEQVSRALTKGLVACYDEAGERCVGRKDATAAIPMLVYWRQLVLFEATSAVDERKLQSCLTFEFRFTSVVHHGENLPGAWLNGASRHSLGSNVYVRWRPPFEQGRGPATVNKYQATWTDWGQPDGCTLTGTGNVTPSALAVPKMMFEGVNSFEEAPPLPKIEVEYNPGNPLIELLQVCPPPNAISARSSQPLFSPSYLALHAQELAVWSSTPPLDNQYRVLDWDVKQGSPYAQRRYSGPPVVGPHTRFSEVTILYLYHKPGG